jgi:rhodanese-related sulfurtransferase
MKKSKKSKIRFSALRVVGLIVLTLIGAVLVINLSKTGSNISTPSEISVSEAYEMRSAGAFILDVREPQEWQAWHIPGATLIPLGELESRLRELPNDQEIVVVCRSGNRSATGRDILTKAGFGNTTSMAGGMNSWISLGYDVVNGP